MALSSQRPEIMQFGTSRFLLAHVDYFVGHSLAAGHSNKRIVVVQTSPRPEGKAKARQLAEHCQYPVHFRGLYAGEIINRVETVDCLAACLVADDDWYDITRRFCQEITHVVSNTGDRGYDMAGQDSPLAEVPQSFPAKLTQLLRARYEQNGDGITLMPCELVNGNGQRLKTIVMHLAKQAYADSAFAQWLEDHCVWVDTLVDRIVSAALDPVGAVAEPYGLWAVQAIPGLQLPCQHPDIQVVEELEPFEKRKLHILNLAHTWLVQCWRDQGKEGEIQFVREAMQHPSLRDSLETLLDEEVLPVLACELPGQDLQAYKATTLERFANPFLDHRLADIAQNHNEKRRRRLLPVVVMAQGQGMETPRLKACVRDLYDPH